MNRNIITSDDAERLANMQLTERDRVLIHEGPRLGRADTPIPRRETGPKPDNYFDRLLKYVPAEMISAYIVLSNPVRDSFGGAQKNIVYWILLAVGASLTAIFAWRVLQVKRVQQLAMTALGFVIFVASKGDAFASFDWWKGYYALAGAVIFLILIAVLRLPQLKETKVGHEGRQ